jgi:MraZ protein
MFLGTYRHSLDAKGRLAIPARMRENLPGGSTVVNGPEGCLQIYPPEEWDRVVQQFKVSSSSASAQRSYMRQLYSSARECEFDRQGRIILSAQHRQYAAIGSSAVVVGMNNLVEIWSEERWREVGEKGPDDFTQLVDRIAESQRNP